MKKVLEEVGKGLINFANIVTALVFYLSCWLFVYKKIRKDERWIVQIYF